jgi:hypothetical protein
MHFKTGKIIIMAKNVKKGTVTALENPKVVPDIKKEAPKMAQAQTQAVAYVNKNALSTDVGQKAVMAWKQTKDVDAQITELSEQNNRQKGAALKMLTLAFIKAAQADKNIKLEDVYLEKSAKLTDLRQRCEVVVGIKVAKKGEDGVERYEMAEWTHDVLPQPKEDKSQPGFQAKENFRSNFAAAMTKCIKAAHAIIVKNLQVTEDKATGTLLISGKAIKERFNVDQVALNEKREIQQDGKEVKLAKIPSFTEIARMSAETQGKSIPTRAEAAKAINPLNEKDVLSGVLSLTTTIGKLKNIGDELATAIEALAEACQDALDRNGEEDDDAAA